MSDSENFFPAPDRVDELEARLGVLSERLVQLEQRVNAVYVSMATYAEIARTENLTTTNQAAADLHRERDRLTALLDQLHHRLTAVEEVLDESGRPPAVA